MQKMGKEQEQRLLSEMTAIQSHVDGGSNPTAALYKVAKAADLSDDMIKLLGCMYNNGRTAVQLRSDDVTEKAAAFPLADPEQVIQKLAGSRPLLPAEEDRGCTVSQVYSLGVPDWATHEEDTEKAARLQVPLQARYRELDKASGREYSPYTQPEQPLTHLRDLRKAAATADNQYSAMMYKLANALDNLASFFTQNSSTKLADVDAVIGRVYGELGTSIMDRVAEALPNGCFRLQMTKDASLAGNIGTQELNKINWRKTAQPMRVDWDVKPFTLVAQCLELCKQANDVRNARDQAKQAVLDYAANVADQHMPRKHEESVWDEIYRPTEKRAAPLVPMMLAGTAGRYVGGMGDAAKADEAKQKDSLDSSLRSNDPVLSEIRTRTMLANMLRSDDVLQGYDEGKITNAFNTLVDMAPTAMGNSAIAQSSLRKYLAQEAMDTFDAEQLLKIDGQLKPPGERMTAAKLVSS